MADPPGIVLTRDDGTEIDTDGRGAVLTRSITSFHGERTVAYFRTQVSPDTAKYAALAFSSADDLIRASGPGQTEGCGDESAARKSSAEIAAGPKRLTARPAA